MSTTHSEPKQQSGQSLWNNTLGSLSNDFNPSNASYLTEAVRQPELANKPSPSGASAELMSHWTEPTMVASASGDSGLHHAANTDRAAGEAYSTRPLSSTVGAALSTEGTPDPWDFNRSWSQLIAMNQADPGNALSLAQGGRRGELPYKNELEAQYQCSLDNLEAYFGDAAREACQLVQGSAFCAGNIIAFSEDNPRLEIVAHEVMHSLQQGGHKKALRHCPSNLGMTSPSDQVEREATEVGEEIARGSPHQVGPGETAEQQGHAQHGRGNQRQLTAGKRAYSQGDDTGTIVLARFPAPADCTLNVPGLSFIKPIIQEGYDGQAYTAIKNNWGLSSWERRWQIYDADDRLLYEEFYTWPHPTLYIPKDVVAQGKAGGRDKPWSVWHKVTKTLTPFGGSNPENFPHAFMKFYVHQTWKDYMADHGGSLSSGPSSSPTQKPDEPKSLDSPGVVGARSVVDYGSVVAMHESYLREIYDGGAKSITESAKSLVEQGLPQGEVAEWATEARNQLKANIRDRGNAILKQVFEQRNLSKYGNKLGPSYQQLYQKFAKQGLSPEEINKKIIAGAGKPNVQVNRWAGRLKIAGRILLVLDIVLAGVKVALAPEGQRTQVALEEFARVGGALALGSLGAELGSAVGGAVGALFGGVGAVPGAIIGGIIGGFAFGMLGGWLAQRAVRKLYELFPPADCVFEGDFSEQEPP